MSDNQRMNISDEAAKIAGDAFIETLTDLRLKEGGGFKVVSQQRRAIRAALEAAAPHLMAQAWDEGEQAGYENKAAEDWGHEQARNPYRDAGAGE